MAEKKEKPTCNFGEHLTIDGYGGSEEKLNDKDLSNFINRLWGLNLTIV